MGGIPPQADYTQFCNNCQWFPKIFQENFANIFKNYATFMNIDDSLVYARVGKDMFERRGGYAYYKKYKTYN